MTEAVWIALAFGLGLGVRQLGLPPLVGYLLAGFFLNVLAHYGYTKLDDRAVLEHLAHLGVLLMLFTIGLKLRLKNIVRPEVMGGGLLHLGVVSLLFAPLLYVLAAQPWREVLILALALGFSSTVMAAKALESKRELRAFHGRVAIGILIMQDLAALVLLSVGAGQTPSLFALGVLALPLLRPVLSRLLAISGHDELLILLGLLLALVIGGEGFHAVGLSAELGALLLGALLANHSRAGELGKALWSLKEIFLVGFFLNIGLTGLPSWDAIAWALLLIVLLPLKTALFFFILVRFRLRARSAFLTSLSLASYSEFGLIVANLMLPEWIVPLALAVALSFVLAAPLNRIAHGLYARWETRLLQFELDQRHPDEQPVSLGMAHILIMGMGRIGTAAYDFLHERQERIVGLDADPAKIERHRRAGRRVLYADGEDPGFWHGLNMEHVDAVILSMNDPEAKITAARQLRTHGYRGVIVAPCLFEDEAEAVLAAGADRAFLAWPEVGVGLAEHVWQALYGDEAELRQREDKREAAASVAD